MGRPEIAEKTGRLRARRNDGAALKSLNLTRLFRFGRLKALKFGGATRRLELRRTFFENFLAGGVKVAKNNASDKIG